MKRILLSLGMIVFIGAVVAGATGAFFSDTETSTGNTFAAGDIDLQIDNESYVTNVAGDLEFSPATSWDLKDLVPGVDHFFDFDDLKPGDLGEDTISIHVGSNNAWMCAAAQITSDLDNTCTDPEDEAVGELCTVAIPEDANGLGELDSALNFVFWNDDGDNVYEPSCSQITGPSCVTENIFLQGPLSGLGLQGQITLADSQNSILGGNTPIPGDTTFYIGKAWCFGDPVTPGVDQDGFGKTSGPAGVPAATNGPIQRPGGVTCNGSGEGNIAQTDSVMGDMQFYAIQARNNAEFLCSEDYTPSWPN